MRERPIERTWSLEHLKKQQKNFVVEYKGARRKTVPQSNSIWGSVDLRRFAEHDGNVAPLGIGASAAVSDAAVDEAPRAPALTTPLQQTPTSNFPPEQQMADETSVTEPTSTATENALPKARESRKRGPRAKNAASGSATSDASVEAPAVKKTRAKRGSRNALAEVKPSTRRGGRKTMAAGNKAVESTQQAFSPLTAAGEEMEDLLQLEQENQRLRKLLAEKLRSENTDLRKRLGLG